MKRFMNNTTQRPRMNESIIAIIIGIGGGMPLF